MKTKNFLMIPILLLLYSCGGGKAVVKEIQTNQPNIVQVITPCTGDKYNSDDKFFRASSSGLSIDQATGKKIALTNTNFVLANDINVFFTALVDQYTGQDRVNQGLNLGIKYKEFIRTTIDLELRNAKNICEVTTQDKTNGQFTVYLGREINRDLLFESVSEAISKDEQLKLDYDYEKFKEEYLKEIDRLRNK